MRKFLSFIVIAGLLLAAASPAFAQAPGVIVIISSDTTWTQADSPKLLTGPVLVNNGVTLTVEAGATVNLNGYELRVNGTLRAIGTRTDQIQFSNGKITFTEHSNAWNPQTGTGSSIQFAILEDVEIQTNVPVSINENPTVEDEVWTINDSPIDFSGQLIVDSGKVLTIESGVTVNLNGYDLVVKGKLRVLGSSSDKVHFNSATLSESIIFAEDSDGWNEETGSGSTIEHAVLNGVSVASSVSLKISSSNINGTASVAGSSEIVCNTMGDLSLSGGSGTVTDNVVGEMHLSGCSPVISKNTIGLMYCSGGSPVISDNTIEGIGRLEPSNEKTKTTYFTADSVEIKNNLISRGIYLSCGSGIISGNTITGYNHSYTYKVYDSAHSAMYYWYFPAPEVTEYMLSDGIVLRGDVHVAENTIIGCNIGISGGTTIQGNLLTNNTQGILITKNIVAIKDNNITDGSIGIKVLTADGSIIENNVISRQADVGISLESYAEVKNNTISDTDTAIKLNCSAKINYNNIENYGSNSIYLNEGAGNIDATNNWWGTTDTQAINLTIYDYKYKFGLGRVDFVSFLTEPNLQTTPNSVPEFPSVIIFPLLLAATLVVVFVRKKVVSGSCAK